MPTISKRFRLYCAKSFVSLVKLDDKKKKNKQIHKHGLLQQNFLIVNFFINRF